MREYLKGAAYALVAVAVLLSAARLMARPMPQPAPCSTKQLVSTVIKTTRPTMGALEHDFWVSAILSAAQAEGAPPVVLAALVSVESRFKGHLVSHKGAKGAAQVMPLWLEKHKGVDLMEIEPNLQLGARILAHYVEKCGSTESALRCYVAGPKNQAGAQWYADRVLARVAVATSKACAVPGTTATARTEA